MVQKGGVFVGPKPIGSKTKSKNNLEQDAIKERTDETDGIVYDDILTEVNIANPNSFVTFARGRAVGLLTKKNLDKLLAKGDPLTRQPFHPEILAWVNNITEGPLFPEAIIPFEHKIMSMTRAGKNHFGVVTDDLVCRIYDFEFNEVVALDLEFENENRVTVSDDGKYAVTYGKELNVARLWNLEDLEIKPRVLKMPETEQNVVHVFFIGNNVYIWFVGNTVMCWDATKPKTKGKIVKQKDLDRSDMYMGNFIHYNEGRLFVYSTLNVIMTMYEYDGAGGFERVYLNKNFSNRGYGSTSTMPSVTDSNKIAFIQNGIAVYDMVSGEEVSFIPDRNLYDIKALALADDYVCSIKDGAVQVIQNKKTVQQIKITEDSSNRNPKSILWVNNKLLIAVANKIHVFTQQNQ